MAKILIVDDEPGIRVLAKFLLEKAGHEVIEADTGEKGLQILEETGVDLIILDIMMPGMNGWEVCHEVRAHDNLKDIPIIMLSVKDTDDDLQKSFTCDADMHIAKPFKNEWLVDSVQRLLEK